ncbi:hypothetical protein ACU4GR_00920 [Methylobacterium oryzae CBMB20]
MRSEAVHQVEQMLGSVDRELLTQIELLKVLAQSPILDSEQPNLAAFHELAERFQGQLPLWHRIILVDTDGHMLVRTGYPFGTPLPPLMDEKSYRRVLDTGEPTIGDLAGPGRPGNGPPRASFRVPVRRDGKIRYVLTGVVSNERLTALLATADLAPAWRPYLVDGSDRIAASLRAPANVGMRAMLPTVRAREAGASGVYDGISPEGEPLVTAFRKSDRTGWSVHVAIPLPVYNQPLTHAAWILAAAGAVAVLLTAAFVLLLRRELHAQRRETLAQERAVRMEALGRMTGGVAHDFNNLLMVILGNLEMLGRRNHEPRLERRHGHPQGGGAWHPSHPRVARLLPRPGLPVRSGRPQRAAGRHAHHDPAIRQRAYPRTDRPCSRSPCRSARPAAVRPRSAQHRRERPRCHAGRRQFADHHPQGSSAGPIRA